MAGAIARAKALGWAIDPIIQQPHALGACMCLLTHPCLCACHGLTFKTEEKVKINTTYYAIVGYTSVPSGALPDVAVPHLVDALDPAAGPLNARNTMRTTLCGRQWGSLIERVITDRGVVSRWAKPVCKRCVKKAGEA